MAIGVFFLRILHKTIRRHLAFQTNFHASFSFDLIGNLESCHLSICNSCSVTTSVCLQLNCVKSYIIQYI